MNKLPQVFKRNSLALTVASMLAITAPAVFADTDSKVEIDIAKQQAGMAMLELSKKTGSQIVLAEGLGNSVVLPAIKGQYTLTTALDTMLKDSGLIYEFVSDDSVLIKQSATDSNPSTTRSRQKEILEELIVTAQKREQSVKDVPISIVAMGATELEERGINNLEDLGFTVPGLEVVDTGPWTRTITLRGIGNGSGNLPTIGLYLDESAVTTGIKFAQIDMRTYDLDRVEVLRGPQGTLYGQGSMGGTIRYITKDPQLDRFSLRTDVSAAFVADGSPGQKLQGVVNIPLVENELGLRIAGVFEHEGGWIDQPSALQEDVNDQNLASVRVKGLWQPVEQLQLKATVLSHRNNAGLPNHEDENGNYIQAFNLAVVPSTEDDYDLYNLTLDYDFGAFSLLSSSNYIDVRKDAPGRGYVSATTPFHYWQPEWLIESQTFNQEVRLSSNDSGPWQWTLGAYYQDAELEYSGEYYYDVLPPGGGLPNTGPYTFASFYLSDSWSVFGNTSYALTDRLEIGAGLRYFEDEQSDNEQIGNFDSVDPRVYVNYDVTENVKTYISAAKGFRSGGFNFAFLNQAPFEPETVWTYELGTKMSVFDGRLDAEIALFYSEYEDYIIFGFLPPPAQPIAVYFNAGTAEIKGVDWGLTWHATDNLDLIFNGNVVNAEFTEINGTSFFYSEGDSLDNVPDYQYSVSVNYDFILGDKPGFFRLDYSQRDETNTAFSLRPSDQLKLLNLRLGWEWSNNLSFGVFAKNLLNERAFVNPPSDFISDATGTRPRTVGIEIGVEFE